MKLKTDSRTALTLLEGLTIIFVLAVFVLAILSPMFAQTTRGCGQTKELSNAKQIGLACKLFASDHDGHFPSGGLDEKGQVVPGAPTSSNAVLDQLLPEYLPEKSIFLVSKDPAYSNPAREYPGVSQMGAGKNHWGYVTNLTEKCNPRFPLIADGAVPGSTAYSTKKNSPGSTWKGKKAIVIRADMSGAIETLNTRTLTISSQESGMVDILQSGQPGWLDKTQVFLNPIPTP